MGLHISGNGTHLPSAHIILASLLDRQCCPLVSSLFNWSSSDIHSEVVLTHIPFEHLIGYSIEHLGIGHSYLDPSIHYYVAHLNGLSNGHPYSLGHNTLLNLNDPSAQLTLGRDGLLSLLVLLGLLRLVIVLHS
jgi:hypothetical protein